MKKIVRFIIVAQLILILVFGSFAQPQQQNQPITVFRAGRVFDSENGAFLPARDIIVKDNPADDFNSIEKVRFVMKNGKVYLEAK